MQMLPEPLCFWHLASVSLLRVKRMSSSNDFSPTHFQVATLAINTLVAQQLTAVFLEFSFFYLLCGSKTI
jgi:hypothetical protein